MIESPIDILSIYPVRKSRNQKQLFRDAVSDYVQRLGYSCQEEKGSLGARNLIIGNPDRAEHLITAHYDTCAAMPIPNFITPCNFLLFILYQIFLSLLMLLPAFLIGIAVRLIFRNAFLADVFFLCCILLILFLMIYGPANRNNANDNTSGVVTLLEILNSLPESYRSKVCFVLFDLEEAGLVGSSSYASKHKNMISKQIIWNLDCVGDGDSILLFPTGKLRKDQKKFAVLQRCTAQLATKSVVIVRRGFSFYPSDQANFPYGVGIAALHNSKYGFYLGRIHTKKDTVLDITNVNILRAAIISAITCNGVE